MTEVTKLDLMQDGRTIGVIIDNKYQAMLPAVELARGDKPLRDLLDEIEANKQLTRDLQAAFVDTRKILAFEPKRPLGVAAISDNA